MSLAITVVVFLLMISVLVAAHEYGHYLFAKRSGMEVEEFAIGFGPLLVHVMTRGETQFTIRAIPLGGFVRIKGMIPEEDGSETAIENGFYSKPPIKRLGVLFAGPLFSLLFGSLVVFASLMIFGISDPDKPVAKPVIGGVVAGGPADKAGLKSGDLIVSIDGQPVTRFFDVVKTVRDSPGKSFSIQYEREGKQKTVSIVPVSDGKPTPVVGPDMKMTSETKVQAKIGAGWEFERRRVPVGEGLTLAARYPIAVGAILANLFTKPAELKNVIGGPGTIAAETHRATGSGLESVLMLVAGLSISLGYINLLPIPPLDGGQMVMAFIEMLRRGRRLSLRVQHNVSTVGLVFVLLLFITAIASDVRRFTVGNSDTPASVKK